MKSTLLFAAKICLQDLCVTLHAFRDLLADLLTKVYHRDPICVVHDKTYVVTYQYYGDATVPYLPDYAGYNIRFFGAHARGRFVEDEELGLVHQGAGYLQKLTFH